jgi:hypothetical protein
MQWEVTLRQLGKYTKKGFCKSMLHKFTTCIPVSGDHQSKLTLMSESLRNDGRIWVPAKLEDAQAIRDGKKNQQNYLKKIEIII